MSREFLYIALVLLVNVRYMESNGQLDIVYTLII